MYFVLKYYAFETKYKEYAGLSGSGRNRAGRIITNVRYEYEMSKL